MVAKHPNAFAWHPSYAQWIPVSCIDEFDIFVSVPIPPSDIPKELYEDYVEKEREMIATLDRIDKTLKSTSDSLADLDHDIDTCTDVAHNLNAQVKNTIEQIEQQYAALKKNLAGVTRTS